ncbi:Fungalysin metallopeptidase-domain-containing protein [Mycena capillaripes]|nr:Fungalysin metallopeptidase-domain-containing protein [Mycena capillaripes]
MVAFNKFFTSVFLAIVYAPSSMAAPSPINSKHATHRTREIARGVKLETYHPASNYETFGEGIEHPLRKRDGVTFKESSVAFLQSKLSLQEEHVSFHSGYEGETNGIFFANTVANVAINKDDKVVAVGHSFVTPSSIAASEPTVSFEDAVATAEDVLDGTYNEHPAEIKYFAKDDGSAVLVHAFQVQNEAAGTWYLAYVDAHANTLVSVTDFVAKASVSLNFVSPSRVATELMWTQYLVLPITQEVLMQGFQTLTDPANTSSTSSTTSQSGTGLVFKYPQSASTAPTTTANVNAARVNNFYVVNTVHDISHRSGFTEKAFNFQQDNFGLGGSSGDRVTASIQDSTGTNNADFSTPPDGQSRHMRVFLWDLTSPERGGALENDIFVHENTHGITNRMTGGGTGKCLQTTEAGGMGEGWSDAMAEWTEQTSATVKDYVMGQYVINDAAGIRSHPYSTSKTTNPLTYASFGTLNELGINCTFPDIGEVWAHLLHNVYAALVSARGFSATAPIDPTSTAGNAVYLHLFIDALPLQPCEPTFLTARDAWIQADVNRYGGANKCILWNAFASRGLGVNAKNHKDDATVPSGCYSKMG